MTTSAFLAIATVATVVFAVAPGAFAQSALSGQVTAEDGLGLDHAEIILRSLSEPVIVLRTLTDRDGRYTFATTRPGEYSLEASAVGFVGSRLSPVTVQPPTVVHKNFVLAVAPVEEGGVSDQAELSGVLKRGDQLFARARICLRRGSTEKCTQTNDLGEYFLAVQPGIYKVDVFANDKPIWAGQIEMPNPGSYRNKIPGF